MLSIMKVTLGFEFEFNGINSESNLLLSRHVLIRLIVLFNGKYLYMFYTATKIKCLLCYVCVSEIHTWRHHCFTLYYIILNQ